MQRSRRPIRLPPSQWLGGVLAMAIAWAIIAQLAPAHAAQRAAREAAWVEAPELESRDALKPRESVTPRVPPCPALDRLPPPSCAAYAYPAQSLLPCTRAIADVGRRRGWPRLPIVKHVPRMERGDPPRR